MRFRCFRSPAGLAGFTLPAALGLLLAAPATAEELPEALAGVWEVDPDESDDPGEVMQRVRDGEDARGRGRFPGARGRGGFGGRGGMGRAGRGGGIPGGALPDSFEIEAGSGEMRVVLEERVRIYYLDGEEHMREDGRGVPMKTVAEVRGGIVRVTSEAETPMGDVKTFHTFQANEDTLVVRTELTLPRRGEPVLIRSVYRRVPG